MGSSVESWSGTVRLTNQLKRDLKWGKKVSEKHNGALIFKPVESSYLHGDSNDFGWGVVLNECREA